MNKKLVLHMLGRLMLVEAGLMLPSLIIAWALKDGDEWPFLLSMLITVAVALPLTLLTRGGDVEEVIPAMFVGSWSGNWSGYGSSTTDTRTVEIESDGTMKYGEVTLVAEYDVEKSQIIGKNADESYVITLTWNAQNGVMSATLVTQYDGSEYTLTCSSLTKA